MQRMFSGKVGALVLGLLLTAASWAGAQQPTVLKTRAPELRGVEEWINTKPTSLKALKGKVVAVHFWTFGCINCIHNYPWYTGWHKDFADKGLTVIGVHTPESADEKKIEKVRKKVKDNGMKYPIAVDGASKIWQAWGNRYWPSVYLIDKKGFVRYRWEGELGSKGEKILRKKIEELLAE